MRFIISAFFCLSFSTPALVLATETKPEVTDEGIYCGIDTETHPAFLPPELNHALQIDPLPSDSREGLPNPPFPHPPNLSYLRLPLPSALPHPVLSVASHDSQATTQAMLASTLLGTNPSPEYAPTIPLSAPQAAFIMTCVNQLLGPGVPVSDYSAIRHEADRHALNAQKLAEETERLMQYQGLTVGKLKVMIPEGYQRPSQERRIIDLSSIVDPDESELPYQFQSQGEIRASLTRLYQDLYKIQPELGKRKKARELGIGSIEEADQSFQQGDSEGGLFYKKLAEEFLDLAIGLDPVTGMGRSTYELLFGRNFVTGVRLNTLDRSLAFLGVVTVGGSRTAIQVGRGMHRIFARAAHLLQDRQAVQVALREGELLASRAGRLLDGWKKNHRITNIHSADHINSARFPGFNHPVPFERGSHVVEFRTLRESQWARVHTGSNEARGWVMRKSAISGLSPTQIQEKFALTQLPTHISDVHLPSKTKMLRGNIQNHSDGISGSVQYFIDEAHLVPDWFRNMRPL